MKRLPNILSTARLIGAPLLVPAAMVSPWVFLAWLIALLVSDGLDGILARRWGVETATGQLLDSWADHAMAVCAFGAVWVLWPEPIRRDAMYVATIAAAYSVPAAYAVLRTGRLFAYHTRLSRLAGAVMALALLPFLFQWTAVPFRIAAGLEVLVALEYFTISLLLPEHKGTIRSVFEARRLALGVGQSVDPARYTS